MKCALFFFLAIISFGYGCQDILPLHHSRIEDDRAAIHFITQACRDDCCVYSFLIYKGDGIFEGCEFGITEADGKPANQTDFNNVPCVNFPKYSINGKHDGGTVWLTVANLELNSKTIFWIEEEDMRWPKVHMGRINQSEPLQELKREEPKPIANAPNWTLRNVLRSIRSNNRIWLGFHITSEGYDPEWCYMLVHVKGDPRTASFTEEPCVGSNFTVSWGYMAENDGGIMTLLNPQGTRSSWFGWNHVNSAEHLDDVGPNATSDVS